MEGVPEQPFADGVTVILPAMGTGPELVAVNEGTFPFPLAAKPMAVLLLTQLKVLPVVGLVKTEAGTVTPLQIAKLVGTTTVGVGLTVIV